MRRILAILLLFSCGSIAGADSPEELVAKLGSPRYADREAAGQALIRMGSAALPALKAAAETSPDAEIRERAQALLDPLLRAHATDKLLQVKRVRLQYTNAPLQSVISDFKAKTNIPVQLVVGRVAEPSRPVTIAEGEYDPWDALEVILKAARLREEHCVELPGDKETQKPNHRRYRNYYYDDEDRPQLVYTPSTAPILLVDGQPNDLPAMRKGGIRITVLPASFGANRVIRGAGRIIFHLDVAPVPGMNWNGATSVRISRAEDEDGRPVLADLKGNSDNSGLYSSNPWMWGGGWAGRRVFWGGGGMMFFDDAYNNGQTILSAYQNPRLQPVAIRTHDRAIRLLSKFDGAVLGEVHTPNSPVITINEIERSIGTAFPGPQQSSLTVQEFKKNKDGSTSLKYRHDSFTAGALSQARGIGGGIFLNDNGSNEVAGKIKYFDAAGKELMIPNNEGNSSNSDGIRQSVEMTVRFPKGAVPVKMILTGVKITPVEVPFSFTNVAIP